MSSAQPGYDFKNSLKKVDSYPFVQRYVPIDRFFIRPAAALIVRLVYKTSLTPNQLTFCSFLLGFAAACVYLGGRPLFFVVGGILVMLSMIFDCADGMLARAKNMSSRFGAFLDLFLDRIADFTVLIGISTGFSLYTRDLSYLVFGLLTTGLYFLQVALYYLENIYKGDGKLGEAAEAKGIAAFVIFLLSLFGRLDAILLAVFVFSFISFSSKVIRIARLSRGQSDAPKS